MQNRGMIYGYAAPGGLETAAVSEHAPAIKDFRVDIPVYSFLNAAIVDHAEKTNAFAEHITLVLANAGLPPTTEYQFKNPAFICGLLYGLIVVPKEVWLHSKDDPIYQRLHESDLLELFTVTCCDRCPDAHSMFHLIRHLRNSIAHANFSVDHTQAFTFWDQKNRGGPRTWEARIANPKLMEFLSMLAHVVVYLRNKAPAPPTF
jgi:hypothetical protein